MKAIITTIVLFYFINSSNAQIFGSNDVCPANGYSYSATIPGAVLYQWNFPPGWYNVVGQGTGSVSVTCNVNAGDIYCEGIDTGGNSIATLVLVTQFGGGTAVGWDVQPQNSYSCVGDPYVLNVVPNGTGGGSCPNSCGNGTAITNIGFAVYDNAWPSGNFIGFANGSILPVPATPGSYTYYIYNIDFTNGTSTTQAIRIEGGCGTASVNNIVQLNIPQPNYPGYTQVPNPVCIGDTVNVWSTIGGFTPIMGVTALSGGNWIVNSMPARLSYAGFDLNGCPFSEICYLNVTTCAPAFLTGDSVLCNGISYTYNAFIPGAITYDWLIPIAWTNVTGQGTSTITGTCNGGNAWISVLGHDATGNIVGAKDLFLQINSPSICSAGSVAGDTTVCVGYNYNYTANIPGAVTYNWSLPVGWYGMSGQGTASITATCNLNDGLISVEGRDATGTVVGIETLLTQFGGNGASGWDVQPAVAQGCTGFPFSLSVVSNGSGGGSCPVGCGNGTLHPNLKYCVYSDVWPTGFFLGYADGSSTFLFGGFVGPVYVYYCDITLGTDPANAVLIQGGCGGGTVNNVAFIAPFPNPNPIVIQTPASACVGDTIELNEVSGLQNQGWGFMGTTAGLTFLNGPFVNPVLAVVTTIGAQTDITGIDMISGCPGFAPVNVNFGNCAALPVAAFQSSDTVFCDKQNINFYDLSSNNPTTWQWTFTGAVPSTSSVKNPQNIYYPTNGAFDVTLVACNGAGCDSLNLVNFIVEHPSPSVSIYNSNDTLYVTAASSYQWYEVDSGLIVGATNSYFVPVQAGNYYCSIVDAVGCSGVSNTIAITTGILKTDSNWKLTISPNPSDGNFQLDIISVTAIQSLHIQISNVLNQIVFEKQLEQVNNKFTNQIDLSRQPKGIYYLKVSSGEKTFSKKIIVQ